MGEVAPRLECVNVKSLIVHFEGRTSEAAKEGSRMLQCGHHHHDLGDPENRVIGIML